MTSDFTEAVQRDAAIRDDPAMIGRRAYDASLAVCPFYHDGTPRKLWNELDAVARWSWSRAPKSPA